MSAVQQALLDHDPAARRAFDFYSTPAWMTRALMRRVAIGGSVLEPCAGDESIANVFRRHRDVAHVVTNDVDPTRTPTYRLDVTTEAAWGSLPHCLWTITNPPFALADLIVPLAVARWAAMGAPAAHGVAMLLRLSWLEPTEARAEFLRRQPPNRLIVLPRHDFKGRGSTDSVTSAWCVWSTARHVRPAIEVVTRAERDELLALLAVEAMRERAGA